MCHGFRQSPNLKVGESGGERSPLAGEMPPFDKLRRQRGARAAGGWGMARRGGPPVQAHPPAESTHVPHPEGPKDGWDPWLARPPDPLLGPSRPVRRSLGEGGRTHPAARARKRSLFDSRAWRAVTEAPRRAPPSPLWGGAGVGVGPARIRRGKRLHRRRSAFCNRDGLRAPIRCVGHAGSGAEATSKLTFKPDRASGADQFTCKSWQKVLTRDFVIPLM